MELLKAGTDILWIESGVTAGWTIAHTAKATPEWALWMELGARAYGFVLKCEDERILR